MRLFNGIAAFALSLASGLHAAEPIALHPDNPHYFLWRGEPTVLVTSGEHYGALLNLDFDYAAYFEALASDGLNHTRVFAGTYREIPSSFGITDNTLAPKPGRYIGPWARSGEAGYFDGGNKFDLTKWDEAYFARLKDLIRVAGERGIVVELTLFCPSYNEDLWKANPMNAANNVNGVGTCPREEVYAQKHDDLTGVQLAFVRKVVAELQDFDNFYYEVANEPYFGGVTMDWQHRVVDAIVEAEQDFPHKHLISLNIANGSAKIESPHPAVSIFNFHYCVPPDVVEENFGLNKVIGENETGFRGSADILYRTEGWDFMLAGGGLYNNLDYSFTPQHPRGDFLEYKSPGGGSPALRKQLGILKRFLDEIEFLQMAPDYSLRGVRSDLVVRALVEPGRAYAFYLHVPLPNKPKPEELQSYLREGIETVVRLNLPPGRYKAEWIDTLTGRIAQEETFSHDQGTKVLNSPRFDNDIALRVVRQIEP